MLGVRPVHVAESRRVFGLYTFLNMLKNVKEARCVSGVCLIRYE